MHIHTCSCTVFNLFKCLYKYFKVICDGTYVDISKPSYSITYMFSDVLVKTANQAIS